MFTWACPQELRIAAMQALEKLDPECVQSFWSKGGINQEDLMLAPLEVPMPSECVRQRRHQRVRLQKPLRAISVNLKENCRPEIKTASLSGGIRPTQEQLGPVRIFERAELERLRDPRLRLGGIEPERPLAGERQEAPGRPGELLGLRRLAGRLGKLERLEVVVGEHLG